MGFVSFLKLGLKCFFDFLAWPLFALICPLYASVQAIESNSNSDMRNLVAYWIVLSLISLFELAFVKLIEWLPFWPYMKLMAICWLGIPNFNGACYVYECLIHSCLSVNLQGVIKRFVKHKDDLPLNAESFLAVAERYVKENGSEELEKLIDRSRHTTPNIDKEEVKAVTNTEEKETATAIQTFKEPNVAKEDAKAVDPKEKIMSDSTHWSKFEEPCVANENAKAGELNEKNPTAATEQVNCVEPNLIQTEKKTVAASEIMEKTVTQDVRENKVVEVPAVAAGGGENKVTEISASEYVQREWTCAACQLTTMCEKNFQSHLQGRKHKAKLAAEEKEIQTFKEANVAKEDAKAVESKEKILSDSTQRSKFKDPNVANKNTKAGELNEKNPAAAIEQVNCVKPNLIQTEKKTVAASEIIEKTVTQDIRENKVVEVPAMAAGGGENKVTEVPASENVQREWTCAACQVTTMCEKNFQSHLQGRKHKAKFAAEEKEVQTFKEANVAKEDAKAVESKEKIPSDSTQWSKFKDPNVANKNTKAGELNEKNPAAAIEQVNCVEPNLIQTERKTVAASEIIEKTVTQDVRENKVVEVPAAAAGGGENKVTEIPASKNVQREWTCAACQVTTICEKNFQSHLQGRKHKAKFAAEEKEIQTIKEPNLAKEDVKAVESKEKIPSDSTQWSKLNDPNVANKNTKAGELSDKNTAAAIEQVNCVEPNLVQTEKKTVAASIEKTVTQDIRENKVVEVPASAAGGGENKVTEIPASENVQREWTCAACQVTTMCEKTFQSHLQGRKHKAKFAAEEKEIQTIKEANVANEDAKAVESMEKIPLDSTQWVIQTEKKTVAASEIIEKTVTQDIRENKVVEVPAAAAGGGENKVTEVPASENVQREWTCAACQVTTMCEKTFQSHLQGRKHKAKFAAEEKEIQTIKEPNVAKEDAKAVESKEKILSDSTQWSKLKDPNVANKNTKAGELNEKNPAAAIEQVNCVERNLIQTETKTFAASKIIEKSVTQDVGQNKVMEVPAAAAGGGENKVTEIPALENVQREWTYAACQVTTMCEKNFQSHLQGRKHNAEFAAEEKEIQVKRVEDRNLAQTEKKTVAARGIKEQDKCVEDPNLAQTEKKTVAARGIKEQDKCVEDPNLAQTEKKAVASIEIKGKTVTAAVRENKVVEVPAATSGGGENKDVQRPALENVQKEWTCAICQVTTTCEADLMSHLYGRKHRTTCAGLQASKQANKNKGFSSSTVNQEQPKKPNNQNKSKKQDDKVQVNRTSEQYKQKEVNNTTGYGVNNNSQLWCIICNVKCLSEVDVASHLKGKRHLSQVQKMLDSLGGGH